MRPRPRHLRAPPPDSRRGWDERHSRSRNVAQGQYFSRQRHPTPGRLSALRRILRLCKPHTLAHGCGIPRPGAPALRGGARKGGDGDDHRAQPGRSEHEDPRHRGRVWQLKWRPPRRLGHPPQLTIRPSRSGRGGAGHDPLSHGMSCIYPTRRHWPPAATIFDTGGDAEVVAILLSDPPFTPARNAVSSTRAAASAVASSEGRVEHVHAHPGRRRFG